MRTKSCAICEKVFERPSVYSNLQWSKRQFCSNACAQEQGRRLRRARRRCHHCGSDGPFNWFTTTSGRISHYNLCKDCQNAERRSLRKTPEQRAKEREYDKRSRAKLGPLGRVQNSKAWAVKNPERYLFHRMKTHSRRASHKGRVLRNITYEEFLVEIGGKVPDTCPVLGIPMSFALPPKSDGLPTVDRFDSSKPYQRDNINIISWRANIIKNSGTADDHRKIADWMDRRVSGDPFCAITLSEAGADRHQADLPE